jgi:hypothetical protein
METTKIFRILIQTGFNLSPTRKEKRKKILNLINRRLPKRYIKCSLNSTEFNVQCHKTENGNIYFSGHITRTVYENITGQKANNSNIFNVHINEYGEFKTYSADYGYQKLNTKNLQIKY